ncbi:hypothetical protein CTEN210_10364 [Chaetoceros tenuissimus]|uniref:Uncharacterized protein n=1 Tax=Chaetoceros tenuissimus TaxID=426638 RepID=A0AAD3CX99_9STRA|nr:hypothetical protein CTEN210_10364 [Chaetoceros tenuissimus]
MRGRRISFYCLVTPLKKEAWFLSLMLFLIHVFSFWMKLSSFNSPDTVLFLETSGNTRNATEVQNDRLTPSDSIPVFYNVYTRDLNATSIETSKSIVDEQMDHMKPFHQVHVRFIGTSFAINNTKTIEYDKEGDEFGTLELLHNYCKENPTDTAVYLHNKGSFHPKPENDSLRRFLTRGALSQECANMPEDTCNVCSSRMSPLPHPHTSGNIWVAKCEYIAKLQNPFKFQKQIDSLYPNPFPRESCTGSGRYASEHWVQSHPSIMPCDLSTDKNFTWGYANVPEADFEIDLRPAPRFDYEIYEKLRTCPSHTLHHRLNEYQFLYKENPSLSWWGWKFYENTTKIEGSFLVNTETFHNLYWVELPSSIKRAGTMIGFTQRMWDEKKEWPLLFGKFWKDISEHELNLLNFLGYSEANWKVKLSLSHTAQDETDIIPPSLQKSRAGENISNDSTKTS